MADTLQLPAEARPLWIEGIFTSEFERDTLPLLFSSDRIFDEYYDALIKKNPHVSVALEQIRARNAQARQQRADGFWQDCVDSLSHCVHLRRCVFEETDFQFSAAQKHAILSMLNIATYFLKESKSNDAMMMRAFELFKKAETAVNEVRHKEDRLFLKSVVDNNFATYFARRKKYKAAAQRAQIGLRAWAALRIRKYELYFAVLRGSGEVWSNRFDEALKLLQQALPLAPAEDAEGGEGGAKEPDDPDAEEQDGSNVAPVRFSIQVLNCGVGVVEASNIALHHNIAIALIGQRRYKDAAPWCAKAMDLATAQSAFLKSTHPIVQTIVHARDFCEKMSFSTKYVKYRMKSADHVSSKHDTRARHMQSVVTEQKKQHQAGGDGGTRPASHQRQRAVSPAEDGKTEKVARNADRHPNSRVAAAIYFPRFAKPSTAEALRTYVRGFSERQLIEEYGFEGPKQRPRPPPKTASGGTRPKPTGKKATPRSNSADPVSARSGDKSSHRSSRKSSPAGSRKSSRSRSPVSSRDRTPVRSRSATPPSRRDSRSPTPRSSRSRSPPTSPFSDASPRNESSVYEPKAEDSKTTASEEEEKKRKQEEEDAAERQRIEAAEAEEKRKRDDEEAAEQEKKRKEEAAEAERKQKEEEEAEARRKAEEEASAATAAEEKQNEDTPPPADDPSPTEEAAEEKDVDDAKVAPNETAAPAEATESPSQSQTEPADANLATDAEDGKEQEDDQQKDAQAEEEEKQRKDTEAHEAEEREAAKKAEEEAAQKQAEEEAAVQKKAEAEAAAKQAEEEEAEKRRQEEEEAKKAEETPKPEEPKPEPEENSETTSLSVPAEAASPSKQSVKSDDPYGDDDFEDFDPESPKKDG